ncbi:MAG: 2-oxoacid:acceptor oxidoreductase family protein, partial [Actinobacteria bacterium]|nr:2-oxoacid:acceptor oxidoreductase family protein [Actinomycetota bacterium]
MQVNQLSWMIGGPAGSGINTSSEIFNKACVRAGLWTFSNIEYHSNIMGRHMFFRVRVSDEPVRSHVEQVDLLLALDSETIFGTDAKQNYQKHPGHLHHMAPDSVIIIDAAQPVNQSDIPREDVRLLALPYDALVKAGVEKADVTYNARRHGVMRNMVPVGAACALLGFDVDRVVAIVAEKLPARRQDLVELNRLILQAGADAATAAFTGKFRIAIRPVPRVTPTLMMRGVEAIAVAKLHA